MFQIIPVNVPNRKAQLQNIWREYAIFKFKLFYAVGNFQCLYVLTEAQSGREIPTAL